jgi:hypothetical protein
MWQSSIERRRNGHVMRASRSLQWWLTSYRVQSMWSFTGHSSFDNNPTDNAPTPIIEMIGNTGNQGPLLDIDILHNATLATVSKANRR